MKALGDKLLNIKSVEGENRTEELREADREKRKQKNAMKLKKTIRMEKW